MQDVIIADAVRTPIGSFLGSLAEVPAARLGAATIAALLQRNKLDPARIEQALMGNVLQAGQGQAPARQAAIYAGLPKSVGAVTIHKVCGSGMRALMDAANAIRAEEYEVVVAGGMESMSNAPHLLERSRQGYRMGTVSLADSMIKDGLWDPYGDKHMGTCAELCAKKFEFTRQAQDAFALESYQRAKSAIEGGKFAAELTAVQIPQKGGAALSVERDEEPYKAPLDKMPKLKPAFDPNGSVTAANASKLNDGAAAMLVLSDKAAKGAGLQPLARLVAQGSAAQDPEWFTTSPALAARQALKRAGLNARDIDLWEVNEAFAVVAMAFNRELELDPAKVNVHGGAVALGHPIGASGARIVTTLAHALVAQKKRYGVAAICIGGGEATAVVLENLRR